MVCQILIQFPQNFGGVQTSIIGLEIGYFYPISRSPLNYREEYNQLFINP